MSDLRIKVSFKKKPHSPAADDNEARHYVFMIKQIEGRSRNEAKILSSETPFKCLEELNGIKQSDGSRLPISHEFANNLIMTKTFKWEIELIIGTFPVHLVDGFAKEWRLESRGIFSRRRRGLELFEQYSSIYPDLKLTCYDKRVVPLVPKLNVFLEKVGLGELSIDASSLSSYYEECIAFEKKFIDTSNTKQKPKRGRPPKLRRL